MALVTLLLLNVSTAGAAAGVVKLTPPRELTLEPPSVASRALVTEEAPALRGAAASAPLPGAALTARLDALLKPNINAVVVDADTRQVLYDRRGDQGAVPASTTKLTTSVAALAALGPDTRLTTSVVQGGTGSIVLVGGGDPTLAGPSAKPAYPERASLTDLAAQTAAALKKAGTTTVRVDYDASLFTGPALAPGWKPEYLPQGQVAPITSLMIDEGVVKPGGSTEGAPRVADPAGTAVRAFVRLLKGDGVSAQAGSRTKAAQGAARLAAVQSPPISALVEELLTASDNDLAEQLARLVAHHAGRPADFTNAAASVRDALASLGLGDGVQTYDGSGLSHSNHITPLALARIVALAASPQHPNLRAAITGMPVAGFTGTLAGRYATGPGAGYVRAKTGTLDGVNTLAGLAYDRSGRLLAFAFMANQVKDPGAALAALDGLSSTLAAS